MNERSLDFVILGLSITSSWGNGHATTYRALVRELARRGHHVRFLERDVPWYAENRDLPAPPYCRTELYADLTDLRTRFADAVCRADVVMVGSYVPEGDAVGAWVQEEARGVVAFYDIDTPVTLAQLRAGKCDYLTPGLIPGYHLYLSFAGGASLRTLEDVYGSPRALPLYCSVDALLYQPQERPVRWDLGYLGTYSIDRQPKVERLLLAPARRSPQRRFVVAGPQYPPDVEWPDNVQRIVHLPPAAHAGFYCSQRFTLNVTRADMIRAGHSPSVRLFEAAACGVPIISDAWPGLEEFLTPDDEILIADQPEEVLEILETMPEERRRHIAEQARARILAHHTAARRAAELEDYVLECIHAVPAAAPASAMTASSVGEGRVSA